MNKELFRLAIPNILTNLTVPLLSLVDMALMGHLDSPVYVLAIGFGTVIFNFLYWGFGFLRMGTTGLTAQAYGKSNNQLITALLMRGGIIAILAALLLIVLQKPILELSIALIEPQLEVIDALNEYYFIRIWAAPATIASYVFVGWFLGMQDAKSPLYLAILVNGINILLNVLFVKQFQMQAAGVAWGTVVAQYAGLVFCLLVLVGKYKDRLIKLSKAQLFDWSELKKFMAVNTDIIIRTLCLMLTLSFFKAEAGTVGTTLGAANLILLEFLTLAAFAIDGFAFSAESLSGKYLGRGEEKQFRQAIRISMRWGLLTGALISIIFLLFGEPLLRLLTDQENIIQAAIPYLPWVVALPIFSALAYIWDGIYIGITASAAMRNTMLFAMIVIFLPAFYLLKPILLNHGIWLALILFMLARGVAQSVLAPGLIRKAINTN